MAKVISKKDSIESQGQGNSGSKILDLSKSYLVSFTINGTSDMLFNRFIIEETEAKSSSKKGSSKRMVDDLEGKLFRCENGNIGLPAEYVHSSMRNSAKSWKDPRNTRKGAYELFKSGIVWSTGHELADLGMKDHDEDRRSVVNPSTRGRIVRARPLIRQGWEATFEFEVLAAEYINDTGADGSIDFQEVLSEAGRFNGVGDYRPMYGRFKVVHYELVKLED